jgi:hypothetical protein
MLSFLLLHIAVYILWAALRTSKGIPGVPHAK